MDKINPSTLLSAASVRVQSYRLFNIAGLPGRGEAQRRLRGRRLSSATTLRRSDASMTRLGSFSAMPNSRSRRSISAQTSLGLTPASTQSTRSEEHTSELQSHSDLVCRLLLEKKKRRRQDRSD